jgi:alanine-glyoxylate transaminase/serine-glyoxylate transaminase/serine-pyruvate transaminase
MDQIQSLLRYVWQTENPMTIAVSGTGTAAMEAAIANATEPGDVVLVGVNGYWQPPRGYGWTIWCRCANYCKTLGQVFTLDELGLL